VKKTVLLLFCVIALLAVGVYIYACLDYSGYLLAYNGISDQKLPDPEIYYQNHWIYQNKFGRTSVIVVCRGEDNSKAYVPAGTYAPVLQTHLTMLSLRKGMTIPQLLNALGMPDGAYGSGISRLRFVTVDGYSYEIFTENPTSYDAYDPRAEKVYSWHIVDPDGNRLIDEADVVAFQWTVRLVYLGIAAVLGAVLVVLIKVPNAIRKRKAATQPD